MEHRVLHTVIGASVTALGICGSTADADMVPLLGTADTYAVLGFEMVDMTVSSGNTMVIGDLGLGPGGEINFSGGGMINGDVYFQTGETASINLSGGSQVTGSLIPVDMTLPVSDARDASLIAAGKEVDFVVSSLMNGDHITATEPITTVNVNGDLSISSGVLTIDAGPNDLVIINITGRMLLTGGSLIDIIGGGDGSNVIFNIMGTGQRVEFNGNSTVNGTVLAPDRDITVSGGFINGAILGGGASELKLQSGPTVTFMRLVPAPSTLAMLSGFGLMATRRRRRC